MRKLFKQYGLLVWLSLILIAGFVSTTVIAYLVSRDTLQQSIAEQALPITGDNIYSEVQKDMLRPVFMSSQMAHDTFVRDWLLAGEQDNQHIIKYLNEIRQRNNALSSFLVSDLSRNYYNAGGAIRTVTDNSSKDQWFFRARQSKSPYETTIDIDTVSRNLTVFINHRIVDYNGKFIGIIGLGLTADTMRNLIDSYQKRFQRSVYFVDQKGNIVLAANADRQGSSIQSIPGLNGIAATILANKKNASLHLEYKTDAAAMLVNSRFIPELGWHLLVEQDLGNSIKPLQDVFLVNLAISGAIMLAVLATLLICVRRYQQRIEKSAATDTLTTLLNRYAFDFIFRQALLDSERSRQPLCVILVDIDFFKKINDKQGHLIGDHVLKEIAMIAKRSLRESDVICRWGGEEFLIMLKNCTLEKATSIAETLRSTIAANDFSRTTSLAKTRLAVTVSMGVAQYKDNDSEDNVFERAEVALLQAKESGRNSVYFTE
ncbi:sensor domain-containing diguanylate cyclase [Undibacterium terreum]|uniref:diguanylate cyclase n=1 Tax=Undibacterium terreum TaxID=1224302 RepID=A0A916UVA8_9BURK|nr:sensor domain-containing diguanylate cyclase [Undibacterium terreum]GGC86826.1 GGDEF domain-containing protein [Undibacterium terreum]